MLVVGLRVVDVSDRGVTPRVRQNWSRTSMNFASPAGKTRRVESMPISRPVSGVA